MCFILGTVSLNTVNSPSPAVNGGIKYDIFIKQPRWREVYRW